MADERDPPGPSTGVAAEMDKQEELLHEAAPSVSVSLVHEPSLSFGVGVALDAPYLRRARAHGLATAARTTGGTGVIHLPGDVLWAVVLPRTDRRLGRGFVHAYGALGQGVVDGLGELGIRADWVDAPGLSEEYCALSARGQVLSVEGRIVGGAAQHATSKALLHHGFVSWEVDRDLVERLFDLPGEGPALRLGGVAGLGTAREPVAVAGALERALLADLGA